MTNAETNQSASTLAAAAPEAVATPQPAADAVAEERIRLRAYELFCERREGGGDAISDWLRAEREGYQGVREAGEARPVADTLSLVGAR
jgi:hypothetical protein